MSAYINNKMFSDSTNAITEVLNLIAIEKKMATIFGVPKEIAESLLEMTSCCLSKVANKYVKQLSLKSSIYKVNCQLFCSELDNVNISSIDVPRVIIFKDPNKNLLHSLAVSSLITLVSSIIEESEEGEAKLMKKFGFKVEEVFKLEKLRRTQIQYLAEQYVLSAGLYDLFFIDLEVLKKCISSVQKYADEKTLIEAYISKEACNKTLKTLFGLRSNHIAEIRKRLNKKVPIGRSIEIKPENDEKIFNAWINRMNVADVRERYLIVSEDLNIGVSEVFRNMEMFEICKLREESAA